MVNARKLALLLWASSLFACRLGDPEHEAAVAAAKTEHRRAEQLWRNCTSCHGENGSGDRGIGAPAIGGLPKWYVEAQLLKFRSAQRGAHFDDISGMKMRPMSLSLADDADVALVAGYVATMTSVRQPRTLTGDAEKGRAALATCAACHGQLAEGNKAMRAPPLARQDDWYLLAQLQKFKSGVRGTNPNDASGATMRPMAMALADEQAMRDVIAAIQTLED